MRNALSAIRTYTPAAGATVAVTMTDVAMAASDGKLIYGGDFAAHVVIPNLGKLDASVRKYHSSSETTLAGFDGLDVSLTDQAGKHIANLTASSVTAGKNAATQATIGSLKLHGNGKALAAALHSAKIRDLSPAIVDALGMIGNVDLDVGGLTIEKDRSGYVVQSDQITLHGDVAIVDGSGNVYNSSNTALRVSRPSVRLYDNLKLRELDAPLIAASGRFVRRSQSGQTADVDAHFSLHDAQLKLDESGAIVKLVANRIEADAKSAAGVEMGKDGTIASRMAGLAPLLKDGELHTRTPMHAGRWGVPSKFLQPHLQLGVHEGTTLDLSVVIRNREIIAAETFVRFSPPVKAPGWLKAGGAYLKPDGSGFELKLDVRGFFDINITGSAAGERSLSLNVPKLIEEIAAAKRKSIESAHEITDHEKTANEEKASKKQLEDQAAVDHAHDDWERKRAKKQGDHDVAKEAFEEPKSPNMTDAFMPGKGLDLFGTSGKAHITLAGDPSHDTRIADGVLLPAGATTTLAGSATGGPMQLSIDHIDAVTFTEKVTGKKMVTGGFNATGVDIGSTLSASEAGGNRDKIDVISIGIKHLEWDAHKPAPSK